jgi:hypothetical protein
MSGGITTVSSAPQRSERSSSRFAPLGIANRFCWAAALVRGGENPDPAWPRTLSLAVSPEVIKA